MVQLLLISKRDLKNVSTNSSQANKKMHYHFVLSQSLLLQFSSLSLFSLIPMHLYIFLAQRTVQHDLAIVLCNRLKRSTLSLKQLGKSVPLYHWAISLTKWFSCGGKWWSFLQSNASFFFLTSTIHFQVDCNQILLQLTQQQSDCQEHN